MTETIAARSSTPWHLWLVGAVGALWNGFGGYDYLMSNTAGDGYLRSMGMTDAQVAYFHAAPAWMTATWALGVWGSVLGTLLLLLRSKWALHAFAASLAGFLGSMAYTHLLSDGGKVFGSQGAMMNGVVAASILFFLGYSWVMTKRGVLR